MTLTKGKMVTEIGRRTQLNNRDVQRMLETLITIWQESLFDGERIEIENLFVLEVQIIDRGQRSGTLYSGDSERPAPRRIRRLILRASKQLKMLLNANATL